MPPTRAASGYRPGRLKTGSACSKTSMASCSPSLLAAGGALPLKPAQSLGSAACSTTSRTAYPATQPGTPRQTLRQHPKQRRPFWVSCPTEPTGLRRPLHRIPDDKRARDNYLWPVWFGVAAAPCMQGILWPASRSLVGRFGTSRDSRRATWRPWCGAWSAAG